MSPSDDLHGRDEQERLDNLVLLALDEPAAPGFEAHLVSCDACQSELAALSHVAGLASQDPAKGEPPGSPPSSVWDGICAELGLSRPPDAVTSQRTDAPPAVEPVASLRPRRSFRRMPLRMVVLAAAALVIAAAAGLIGYGIGHAGTNPPALTASAQLASMPGGPTGVSGTARVEDVGGGQQLSVKAQGLPPRNGYYEVWLYNPGLNQMVAVGTLSGRDTGTFPVPPGLDTSAYSIVDVSAQHYDGNPAHQQSVLRGTLTR